jgi:prolyl oligopeptidase
MKLRFTLFVLLIATAAGSIAQTPSEDPYLWLEEVHGEQALSWVEQQNQKTLERLTSHPQYQEVYQDTLRDLTQSDRLPKIQSIGDYAYDLVQDADHVRGLWSRAKITDFLSNRPDWQPVLDLDKLGKDENASWVFRGANCVKPDNDRCMLTLSPGGSDASVYREFDLVDRKFVEGGFYLPEVKASLAWEDRDTLLVSAATTAENSSSSGYGRTLKRWRRGKPLVDEAVVLEVPPEHMAIWPSSDISNGERYTIAADLVTIFDSTVYLLQSGREPLLLPFPTGFQLFGFAAGRGYGVINQPFQQDDENIKSGSMVAFPIGEMVESGTLSRAEVLFSPTENQAISALLGYGTVDFDDAIYFVITEDVVGKLKRLRWSGDGWAIDEVALPDHGAVAIVGGHKESGTVIANYQNLVTPPTIYSIDDDLNPRSIVSLKPKFDASGLIVEQNFATSKDGTRVPYFIARPRDLQLDGTAPTLIGAYGGFGLTISPNYMGMFGGGAPFKSIIQAGGIYVSANIRGGGEYGPDWHNAGKRENRQRVYDDFYAVAEDLIARRYTTPKQLGISGASNSGLLVGVAVTQRPDLYSAALCGVPLLDMKRYHKLLAGASWMAEYGDPDNPEDWEFIEKYSPYHNVRPMTEYPEVMFWGSTKDDRVHPGHSRKMAAKMMGQGHPILFYEETEGGHGTADLNQQARLQALQAIYLIDKLTRG